MASILKCIGKFHIWACTTGLSVMGRLWTLEMAHRQLVNSMDIMPMIYTIGMYVLYSPLSNRNYGIQF